MAAKIQTETILKIGSNVRFGSNFGLRRLQLQCLLFPDEPTSSVRPVRPKSGRNGLGIYQAVAHKLSSRPEIGSVGRDRFLISFKANARYSSSAGRCLLTTDCVRWWSPAPPWSIAETDDPLALYLHSGEVTTTAQGEVSQRTIPAAPQKKSAWLRNRSGVIFLFAPGRKVVVLQSSPKPWYRPDNH